MQSWEISGIRKRCAIAYHSARHKQVYNRRVACARVDLHKCVGLCADSRYTVAKPFKRLFSGRACLSRKLEILNAFNRLILIGSVLFNHNDLRVLAVSV